MIILVEIPLERISNDETCPLHIAAAIEQYLDEEPSVDIAEKE